MKQYNAFLDSGWYLCVCAKCWACFHRPACLFILRYLATLLSGRTRVQKICKHQTPSVANYMSYFCRSFCTETKFWAYLPIWKRVNILQANRWVARTDKALHFLFWSAVLAFSHVISSETPQSPGPSVIQLEFLIFHLATLAWLLAAVP